MVGEWELLLRENSDSKLLAAWARAVERLRVTSSPSSWVEVEWRVSSRPDDATVAVGI